MKEEGLVAPSDFSVSNCKSKYETVEEETQARLEAVTEVAKVFKANLPVLLRRLSRFQIPETPRKSRLLSMTLLKRYKRSARTAPSLRGNPNFGSVIFSRPHHVAQAERT